MTSTESQLYILGIIVQDVGQQVLRITENEAQNLYSWWIIESWSVAGENSDSLSHSVSGFEVTAFFEKHHTGKEVIITGVNKLLETLKKQTMTFHKDFKYKTYSTR